MGVLERNLAHPKHEFWPDDIALVEAVGPMAPHLLGYRQIADAHSLGLALRRRGTLASFDQDLRALATGEQAAGLQVVLTTPSPRPRP